MTSRSVRASKENGPHQLIIQNQTRFHFPKTKTMSTKRYHLDDSNSSSHRSRQKLCPRPASTLERRIPRDNLRDPRPVNNLDPLLHKLPRFARIDDLLEDKVFRRFEPVVQRFDAELDPLGFGGAGGGVLDCFEVAFEGCFNSA